MQKLFFSLLDFMTFAVVVLICWFILLFMLGVFFCRKLSKLATK